MPRKRKAARSFQRRGPVTRRVADQFADDFALYFELDIKNFYQHLPTPAERAVFARLFPDRFLDLWNFEYSAIDEYPASVGFETNVFCRVNCREFLQRHGADISTFDPPDLSQVPCCDRYLAMARARADWWKRNKLPETVKESAWRDAEFIGASLDVVAMRFARPEHPDIERALRSHQ